MPIQVAIRHRGTLSNGVTANVSYGGVAVTGVARVALDEHVEVTLDLDGSPLLVAGIVVWCGSILGAGGCGIAFEGLEGADARRLASFIDARLG